MFCDIFSVIDIPMAGFLVSNRKKKMIQLNVLTFSTFSESKCRKVLSYMN